MLQVVRLPRPALAQIPRHIIRAALGTPSLAALGTPSLAALGTPSLPVTWSLGTPGLASRPPLRWQSPVGRPKMRPEPRSAEELPTGRAHNNRQLCERRGG